MNWFNTTKPQNSTPSVSALLTELLTNGVSINIGELMQYQNKTTLIDLTPQKNIKNQMSGNYLARSKGRGMEFDEVRHYQTGDDIRTIDWRVTARTGKTHTKLFREEVERPVLIATDLNTNMNFGSQLLFKSVQAAHLAALVAWHAKNRGDRIGGIVFNEQNHTELKPRSRQQGVLHYLHALCQHQNAEQLTLTIEDNNISKKNFADNCARLRQLSRPGSLVYLITDGHQLSDTAIRHLSQISQHCELIVCLISDPLEQQLPESKQRLALTVTDGTNKQQLALGDQSYSTTYAQQAQNFTNTISQQLAKAGARILAFTASESLEQQLKSGVNLWIR